MEEKVLMEMGQILIADDDPSFLSVLEDIIRSWGYEVLSARNGMDAWQILLREDAPRIMILDWMMPGMDGLEICQRVRAKGEDSYAYIILITVQDELDKLVQGFSAGADDYLTKPFIPIELKSRLLAGKRILDLQSQLISTHEMLRLQAIRDPLTALLNRDGILQALSGELSRATREAGSVAVIMLDIDHFKDLNDMHGHLVGDFVLIEVAQSIEDATRTYDAVGRYGGDEFLIVLPGCDIESALFIAERIRGKLAHLQDSCSDECLSPTASMGVAATSTGFYLDAYDLIWAADAALLQAKHRGRDRIEVCQSIPGTELM
jgi:two-component system cell cycle response regulator